MASWIIDLKGESFSNHDGSSRQAELSRCVAGEPVSLVPEPENRIDPEAVAVISARGVQIGYLPKGARAIRGRVLAGNPIAAQIDSIGRSSAGPFGASLKVTDETAAMPAKGNHSEANPAKGCVVMLCVLSAIGIIFGASLA